MGQENFEDIRPYRDHEVHDVVQRLIKDPTLYTVLQYVHPDWTREKVKATLSEVNSIDDFQYKIAHPALRILVNQTVDNISLSGMENIENDESYLFISNHRDIILDSAILNILLLEQGYGTIQTAIGSNLLSDAFISDMMKLNKNFVVKRNTGAREFYENSMHLSRYIRQTISEKKEGIWIAQREGRTKDGMDKTQPGLLKMLSISCKEELRECFKDLRVTPVAISYEYDPCDVLKIPELKAMSRDEKYVKKPDEDFNSIITGLKGHKGRVHIGVGNTIKEGLSDLADFPALNVKLKILGKLIDEQIYQNYRLWPSNYLAFDLLNDSVTAGKPEYEGREPAEFEAVLKERLASKGLNTEEDYQWLLKMYANPVKNRIAVESP